MYNIHIYIYIHVVLFYIIIIRKFSKMNFKVGGERWPLMSQKSPRDPNAMVNLHPSHTRTPFYWRIIK